MSGSKFASLQRPGGRRLDFRFQLSYQSFEFLPDVEENGVPHEYALCCVAQETYKFSATGATEAYIDVRHRERRNVTEPRRLVTFPLRGESWGASEGLHSDARGAQGAVGNAFGTYFRVTTYGESHGCGVGCVIDGCPPQIPLSEADIQLDLNRSEMSIKCRPSHADATYDFKYGVRSVQGGGRSSARETIGRVAAGAVAKKILKQFSGTEVLAYASQVHDVVLPKDLVDHESLTLDQIESTIVRCPNHEYAEKMIAAIDDVRVRGDSVGGIVTCIVRNVPRGLGSPVFDKLGAELAKAAMSLPASMGFEIGSGFAGTFLTGSEHNDEFFIDEHGRIRTRTNRSGGIQRKQHTVTRDKQETELIFRGQQDPCVVPRAVPVVEAMVAPVLVDQLMAHYAQCQMFPINPALQEPLEFPRLLEPAATAL
ncbi:hypothetical protein TEA_027367 [Camellia sinensis var. sinensis]|uniref:chorismate synthase n=1 Tax=Camellia sinensis var. sinensis TaxID=542762 RepID=A0A4S4EBH6_CAMSN|nr:hypothetical protein TEA_027367 [Camellia sinensis var. sinensis]